MFDIGWSELMLIGIVALIVIGPKELPSVLRTVGRTVTKLRRMAGEFQGQFQDALREADIADMRKEISDVTDSARSTLNSIGATSTFDPLRTIRDEIRATVEGGAKADGGTKAETEIPAAPLAGPDASAPDPLSAVRDEIRATVSAATRPAGAAPEALIAQDVAPAPLPTLDEMLPPPPNDPLPPPVFPLAEPPVSPASPQSPAAPTSPQ